MPTTKELNLICVKLRVKLTDRFVFVFATRPMHKEWFDAAQHRLDDRVAEMLAQRPFLIDLEDKVRKETALHFAVYQGHEKVVARLLAARPALIYVRNFLSFTALDLAARFGHANIVTQMLSTTLTRHLDITVGLYHAVLQGHDKVVDLLLNNNVGAGFIVAVTDECASMTLFHVIKEGLEELFSRLLTVCPRLIDALDEVGATALHCAAKYGHENLVAQILTLRPTMISAVGESGRTVLMCAVEGGRGQSKQNKSQENITERLLAMKPELIAQLSSTGNTVLHYAVAGYCCDNPQFVAKLWRLNPQALTHANSSEQTPFHYVVLDKKFELIELFQWSLSFDEIVSSFTRMYASYHERYRPVMEQQCKPLCESLNRDVTGIVFEYLGL